MSSAPLYVRVDDLAKGTSKDYAFYISPVSIGRDVGNDVVLDAPFVSSRHGLIRFDRASIEYTDLGSANGTVVCGDKLEPNVPVRLSSDVELRIVTLRFVCARGRTLTHTISNYGVEVMARPSGEAERTPAPTATLPQATKPAANADFTALVAQALVPLQPHLGRHRRSATALLEGAQRVVDRLPQEAQAAAILAICNELPALAGDPAFRAFASARGASLAGTDATTGATTQMVAEFAETLVPGLQLSSPGDIERFLARVATSLETSIRAFVQLRLGHEQFCAEMGLPSSQKATPLDRATDAKAALAFLLDINADVTDRIRTLTAAFADLMTHQVALLSGTMEGVRNLLAHLSPAEIDGYVQSSSGLSRVLSPFRRRWRAFVERHRELTEEERQLSAAVFGERFARGYTAAFAGEGGDLATPRS